MDENWKLFFSNYVPRILFEMHYIYTFPVKYAKKVKSQNTETTFPPATGKKIFFFVYNL